MPERDVDVAEDTTLMNPRPQRVVWLGESAHEERGLEAADDGFLEEGGVVECGVDLG